MLKTQDNSRAPIFAILLILGSIRRVFVFGTTALLRHWKKPRGLWNRLNTIPQLVCCPLCAAIRPSAYFISLVRIFVCYLLAIVMTTFISDAALAYDLNAPADFGNQIEKQRRSLRKRSLSSRGKRTGFQVVINWRED